MKFYRISDDRWVVILWVDVPAFVRIHAPITYSIQCESNGLNSCRMDLDEKKNVFGFGSHWSHRNCSKSISKSYLSTTHTCIEKNKMKSTKIINIYLNQFNAQFKPISCLFNRKSGISWQSITQAKRQFLPLQKKKN